MPNPFSGLFGSKKPAQTPAQTTTAPVPTPTPARAAEPVPAPVKKSTLPWETAAPVAAPASASAAQPRIDLAKRAPGLIDLNKKAAISLEKRGVRGERAAVYLVGDHSGSMGTYYRGGALQRFTERVLALALEFDDDGSIPVCLFDSVAHPFVDVSVDDYQGAIGRLDKQIGHRGTTNYAAAIERVVEHYQASGSTDPAYVVFQTDGSPDSKRAAETALCQAAALPIFWQFVGFGSDRFEFLRKLDDLAVPKARVIDNAGFFEAGADPDAMSDEVLYDNLMEEFPSWLKQARKQGIVR